MNRYKKLGFLFGVLLVLTVVTIAAGKYKSHKEEIRESGRTIMEIAGDSVDMLSWDREGKTLTFNKSDEAWKYADDENFPVNAEKIADLLAPFQKLTAAFVIDNVKDYGQYGLEKPEGVIRIKAGDSSYEVKLGAFSKMDSQRYLSIGDGRVYLVKEDLLKKYSLELGDIIQNDTLPSLTEVSELTFSGTENYSVTREENSTKSYCADDVYFTEGKPLDTKAVKKYLDLIGSLKLTDYASYHVSEEELKTFGLEEPELTLTAVGKEKKETGKAKEKQLILHISRDPGELASAQKKAKEGEEVKVPGYIRAGDSRIVYRVSEDIVSALMAVSYDDLRHKEVLTAAFGDINQIDVSLDGNSYRLFTKGTGSRKEWHYKEGDKLEIEPLQKALTGLQAVSFTSEKPVEKEELGMTVHLDNKNRSEVSIRLYRYDGERCLAVINGESVSFVSRSSVISLVESVYAIVLKKD